MLQVPTMHANSWHLQHDMFGYYTTGVVMFLSFQEHIIPMTSLLHHSNYLLPELECVAHISVVQHV